MEQLLKRVKVLEEKLGIQTITWTLYGFGHYNVNESIFSWIVADNGNPAKIHGYGWERLENYMIHEEQIEMACVLPIVNKLKEQINKMDNLVMLGSVYLAHAPPSGGKNEMLPIYKLENGDRMMFSLKYLAEHALMRKEPHKVEEIKILTKSFNALKNDVEKEFTTRETRVSPDKRQF